MKSYLEVVEIGVRRIDRLLPAAKRRALHEKVDPLLKRYRARKGKDDPLLRKIVAAFRAYPAAYSPLLRDLHRIEPKRWRKPVAKGRAKIKKKGAPPKKASGGSPVKDGVTLSGLGTTGRSAGYGSGMGRVAIRRVEATVDYAPEAPAPAHRGQRAKPPLEEAKLAEAPEALRAHVLSAPSIEVFEPVTVPRARTPAAAPQPEKPRWIIAEAHDLEGGLAGEALRAFRAGAEHEISVHIGAAADAGELIARGASAADSVVPEGQSCDLTVVFFVPALGLSGSKPLHIPAHGDSAAVAFRFKAGKAGSAIEAYMSLVRGGRVLQTAILAGDVVADPAAAPADARLTLRLQIVVPGFRDVGQREPFDATLVAASHPSGRPTAAGIGGDAKRVVVFDNPGLDDAGAKVRDAIKRVVDDPDSFRGGLESEVATGLLWELAQYGVLLYDAMGRKVEHDLANADLSRLQIVQASANAFVPLEFVYDLPAPATVPALCPNWKEALQGKPCPPHVPDGLGGLKHVCPSGFWGIRKVIERQVLEQVSAEDLRLGRGFGVRAEPSAERPSLAAPARALFAWSEILDNVVGTTSKDLLKALKAATSDAAVPVSTWMAWADRINTMRPDLLVLLSHTTTKGPLAIQIGPPAGLERRTLAQINEQLVKKLDEDTPIVVLLGCDTAVSPELTTFVGRFRDKGAAVVVGTITPVLGEHSAAVVKALLETITAAAAGTRGDATRFGEIMRDVRRELLAKGELTALCATSFGDADWRIARAAG